MKRAIKYGSGILGRTALLLFAGGLFLTATGPGQNALLGLAGWALSSGTMTVETGELSGSLFHKGEISRITVSDEDGPLVELERIRFDWSPSGLLDGRIVIKTLQVGRADLRRVPSGKDTEAGGPADAAPGGLPFNAGNPELLPLTIGHWEIGETILAKPVLGTPARLSISGQINAVNPKEAISASLVVQDMDRPSFASAHAEYRAGTGTLRIDANAEDRAGGVLNSLLDIEDGQDLKLALKGNGRLDNWRGEWMLDVNNEQAAGGRLALSGVEDGLNVAIDADGEIGRFLPGPYASLLSGKSSLNLNADYLDKDQIRLHDLNLDAPRIRVQAVGTADLTGQAISGKGRIELGEGPESKPVSVALNEETNLSVHNAEIIFDAIPANRGTELNAAFETAGLAINGHFLGNLSARTHVALTDWQPDITLSDLVLKHPRAEIRQSGAAQLRKTGQAYTLDNLVLKSGKGQLSANAVIRDRLDGKITLSAVPLSITGMLLPDIALQGTLDSEITLKGTADDPEADYSLSLHDVSEPELLSPVVSKVDLSATGGFSDETLTIDAKMSGADGVSLSTSGAIRGLGEANMLELKARGIAPMRLANSFLALRGTQIEGKALIDLAVSGQAGAPVINGSVTAADATMNDPPTGISLTRANLAARLSNGKIHITNLKARSAKGGAVEASGTLDVSTPGKVPAALKLAADNLNFDDGRIVAGQASGRITLQGDLLGTSQLSGTVDIARLDVRIPQALPASVTALELRHENAPEHVRALQRTPEKRDRTKLPSTIKLSLDVRSANRIFVTGRGLDAQLGGQLQLLGSADNPRAIGQFTLEDGRMAVLGRTLDITSGTLDFSGDLDPRLNFTAVTEADNTRITITVTGNASNPRFGFSSEPELPEDEILALLLFNKSLAQLTPVQLVQLTSQVSELGGLTGGPGVLDKLKSSLGVDRLDVTTTKDGEVAVTAGSYVNENLYVGVEQGTPSQSSRVKVDLDITKSIKLRGEAGADGESKLGVGVEWEY